MTDAEQRPALNPWLSMWTEPRRTMRQVLAPDPWKPDPDRIELLLFSIGWVSNRLDRANGVSLGDRVHLPWPALAVVTALSGILFGAIVFSIYAFLVHWTGRWFGGKGSHSAVRAATAWPNVILAWGLLLWVPQLLLFRGELFTEATPRIDADPLLFLLRVGFGVLDLAVGIWFAVVLMKSLSEVQEFSVWRAIANSVAAGLILIAPFALLVLAARAIGR